MTIQGITTFKCENHASIISSSKVVWDEGLMPHRVVLRKEGDEYITHMENLVFKDDGFKHLEFYWGHYFKDSELEKAKEDFNTRVTTL